MNLTGTPTTAPASFRIRPFGKANGALNYTSREPIATDALRRIAPSVFAEDKHDSRSERYTYIPTAHLLEQLAKEGFRPFSVMQGGSRTEEKRDFTKHLLRFRHESQTALQVGGHHNEIILINSHDGTSSYQLMAGVFRMVCGNGMVVADSLIENVKVKHTGDVVANVIDGCIQVLQDLPQVQEAVREMSALNLTDGERQAFAKAALVVRYGDEEPAPIQAANLLTVRRQADAAPNVWNTLNTIQEGIIRGGVGYVHRNERQQPSHRRTRPINGIDQNTNVNKGLWTLAEEMRRLKTA